MLSTNQKHDRRTVIHGTGQLLLCPGVATVAAALIAGFIDYQLIDEMAVATKAELREKMFPNRGNLRTGKTSAKMTEESYEVTFGQLGYRNACLLYNANPDRDWGSDPSNNAQTGISATAGTAFDFDTGVDGVANAPGRLYQIRDASGNPVRNITACTFAGVQNAYGAAGSATALAEGIDYWLDKKLGLVKFFNSIDDDVITPTITSETINAASTSYMKYLVPGEKAFLEGIARVYFWDSDDDDNLALMHEDCLVRITPSSGPTFNQDFVTVKATVKVLEAGYVGARPDTDPDGASASV